MVYYVVRLIFLTLLILISHSTTLLTPFSVGRVIHNIHDTEMTNKSHLHSQHLKHCKTDRVQVTIINTRKQVENRLEKQWETTPPGFTIQ